MSKKKQLTYGSYLQLDKILDAQLPESVRQHTPSHDEMLFIIIHQTYELWFKHIIHELDSILSIMNAPRVDERSMRVIVHRLKRIIEIQKILIEQISILETMTPMEFLEFRHLLGVASGFQSVQFRKVEIKLGLQESHREEYGGEKYYQKLEAKDKREILELLRQPSLFDLVEQWLQRNPFLSELWKQFKKTAAKNADSSAYSISTEAYDLLFDQFKYEELRAQGLKRLSYEATKSALFIMLYRDEPIFHLPYQLLESIIDVDEQFTQWRFRHALMVQRMIGMKFGTGGSPGYKYLLDTTIKHRVFQDLTTLSTYLVPSYQLPKLTRTLKLKLGFHFGKK